MSLLINLNFRPAIEKLPRLWNVELVQLSKLGTTILISFRVAAPVCQSLRRVAYTSTIHVLIEDTGKVDKNAKFS